MCTLSLTTGKVTQVQNIFHVCSSSNVLCHIFKYVILWSEFKTFHADFTYNFDFLLH